MKHEDYIHYSEIYDFFFELLPTPPYKNVLELLIPLLCKKAQVADLGAGTGQYAHALEISRPDLFLTLVDASEAMLTYAKKRVSPRHRFICSDYREYLSQNKNHDAILFSRSLYPLGLSLPEYVDLFTSVHQALHNDGYLVIDIITGTYDIDALLNSYRNFAHAASIDEQVFNEQWLQYEQILHSFNQHVADGTFTLFPRNEEIDTIEMIAMKAGFSLVVNKDNTYIFCKQSSASK